MPMLPKEIGQDHSSENPVDEFDGAATAAFRTRLIDAVRKEFPSSFPPSRPPAMLTPAEIRPRIREMFRRRVQQAVALLFSRMIA
jgi:hypothetical protein